MTKSIILVIFKTIMVTKNKKDLIYDSGVKLFGKFGVKKVSIDMIVKEAGVAKGTFYLYYKNKEKLYEEIIGDILSQGRVMMEYLFNTIPDIKDRFYRYLICSLGFFKKNKIIKNLIDGNQDYFIGSINHEYLFINHIKFIKILLGNDFTDEKFITFVSNVEGFYMSVLNNKSCFLKDDEFEEFVMNLAAVIVNGLFSDFENVRGTKTFKGIQNICLIK